MFSSNVSLIARPTVIGYAPIVRVTTLTGGGDDSLDGLDIEAFDEGYVLGVLCDGRLKFWELQERVDQVEDAAAYVVPDDDDELVWVSVL